MAVVQAELCIYSSLKRLPVARAASLMLSLDFLEFYGVRRSAAIRQGIAFLHTKRIATRGIRKATSYESIGECSRIPFRIEHSTYQRSVEMFYRSVVDQLSSILRKNLTVLQCDTIAWEMDIFIFISRWFERGIVEKFYPAILRYCS